VNVVFAIGCKSYTDPDVAPLQYADQDAKRFVETVMGTQDPDNTETYLLHDGHEIVRRRPTRSNILYFLSRGARRDKSNELDFLFFYFSGHGWSSKENTDYLLTSDSILTMPEDTALSVPMLEGRLRNWEAKHVVLFIHACRTVIAGGKGITIEEDSRIDVDSLCPDGMVTFCSCAPGQTSYEADQIGGVFTEGVCKALSDEGRYSTIQELDAYLSYNVPKISETYGLPPQRPYSRVEPLGVQKALIVSQRKREAWQIQENGDIKQVPPETTSQENPLGKYREFVEWAWTGEQLSEQDVQRLRNLTDRLKVDTSSAAAIERDVMGETIEGILERQERKERLDSLYAQARSSYQDNQWQTVVDIFAKISAEDPDYPDSEGLLASAREALETARKEEESLRQYREAVESAWTSGELDSREVERLRDLASELGLNSSAAADIEREVMGDTIEEIVQRQEHADTFSHRTDGRGPLPEGRRALKVFCSYSHSDEHYLEMLKTWLIGLEREGLIEEWHDRMISAGGEWEEAIAERLETSDIVLLLITPDFMASQYIYEKEISLAIERHRQGRARVIPIMVRPSPPLSSTPFSKLQALPKHGKPITTWPNQDEAWLDTLNGIEQALEELLFRSQKQERSTMERRAEESGDSTDHVERLSFQESDRRYVEIKRRYEAGSLTDEEFDEQLKQLMVQDEEDRWWIKHRETGEWYYYDGTTWIKDTPPVYKAKRPRWRRLFGG
jgi:uncharacterized caspase-like protein